MDPRADTVYLHGTTPAEKDRLARLNQLLNGACLTALALSGGERVLDVGAGLGILGRAIARAAPDVRVVGVERDPGQRAAAEGLAAVAGERGLVEWRAGDAHDLPLAPDEWGTFDVAFARYVVEHSPTPARIVAEMTRAVRPGGRVVVIDDDYSLLRVHPEIDGLMRVWDAFCGSVARLGLDPWIGRRLPALLHGAGLEVRRCDWIFFGGCHGEHRFERVVTTFRDMLDGAREHLLADGSLDAGTLDDALTRFASWRESPGAALWYGACLADGRRPAGSGFTLTP